MAATLSKSGRLSLQGQVVQKLKRSNSDSTGPSYYVCKKKKIKKTEQIGSQNCVFCKKKMFWFVVSFAGGLLRLRV